jgi:uncharacterized protein (TIGR02266 family)
MGIDDSIRRAAGQAGGPDQRRHERTPVTLVVDYDGADDFVGDYTENLSHGGTFIHTSRPLAIGSEIRLVLSFPGLLEPIAVDGVVRWTRTEPDHGVGIEFLDGPGREKLAELVERILKREPGTVARVIKMLVVEDNEHVSALVTNGLAASAKRNFGDDIVFTFATAATGQEALQLLASDTFDAVLIDVYLPVIDGPRVIDQARRELGLVNLPIIAVSAGGEVARSEAMAAGATIFIDKPMRLRQLIDTLRGLLQP